MTQNAEKVCLPCRSGMHGHCVTEVQGRPCACAVCDESDRVLGRGPYER